MKWTTIRGSFRWLTGYFNRNVCYPNPSPTPVWGFSGHVHGHKLVLILTIEYNKRIRLRCPYEKHAIGYNGIYCKRVRIYSVKSKMLLRLFFSFYFYCKIVLFLWVQFIVLTLMLQTRIQKINIFNRLIKRKLACFN